MKNRHFFTFILSFIVLFNIFSNENKSTIAVLYFENNININIVNQIYDYFIISLNEIGKYKVVERNQLEEVLKEQELQLSGVIEQKNQIRIGKLLSSEYVLIGSIYYKNSYYNITAKIIDVETGRIINGTDITCKNENNLKNAIKKASYTLCNLVIPEYIEKDTVIEIKGYGFISDGFNNKPQAKLMAKRAAEIDAKRNLLEYVMGLKIISETKIENFIPSHDIITTKISGYVHNVEIADINYDDNICEVTISFNLKDIYNIIKSTE